MPTDTKHAQYSPLNVLSELAVEGTSSLMEAQRTLLDLAKQENDILLNGVKERVGNFAPGIAVTDIVRRSVDTLLGMQHELLTATAKQTMQWVNSEKSGKDSRSVHAIEIAREAVEAFMRAHQKFLGLVEEETAKAATGKVSHEEEVAKKTELAVLAREAANAFIDAQKRLLDVMSQQVNVNLDLSAKSLEMLSASELVSTASLTKEGVKNFFRTETDLVGSLMKPRKPKTVGRGKSTRKGRSQHKPVAV